MISEGIEFPMGFQQIFIMSPDEILTHRYHWLLKKKILVSTVNETPGKFSSADKCSLAEKKPKRIMIN